MRCVIRFTASAQEDIAAARKGLVRMCVDSQKPHEHWLIAMSS